MPCVYVPACAFLRIQSTNSPPHSHHTHVSISDHVNSSTAPFKTSTHPESQDSIMCSASVPDGQYDRNGDVVPRAVDERDAPMENVFLKRRMRRILGLMPVSNAVRSARRG